MNLGLLAIAGAVAFLLFVHPFAGLLLVITANQIESFVPLPEPWTLGRLLALPVLLGWLACTSRERSGHLSRTSNRIRVCLVVYLCISTVGAGLAVDARMAWLGLLKLAMLAGMVVFIQDLVDTRRKLRLLIMAIGLSYGLSSIVGIIQFRESQLSGTPITGDASIGHQGIRYAAFQSNPNSYAIALMSGIPYLVLLLMETRKGAARVGYIALLGTSVFALALTASRTHVLGLFVFVGIYAFAETRFVGAVKTRAPLVFLVLALVVTVFLLIPDYASERLFGTVSDPDQVEDRVDVMRKGLVLVEQAPLVGIGLGNSARYQPLLGVDAHDTVGFSLGETGVAGFVLLVVIVILAIRQQIAGIRKMRSSGDTYLLRLSLITHVAFLAILASSLGHVIVFQRMFWTYIAVGSILSHPARFIDPTAARQSAPGLRAKLGQ